MKLIIASHGQLAGALLKSAELIVGRIKGAVAFGLTPEMGPNDLETEIEKEIQKAAPNETILLGLDLLGGTPSNVAVKMLAKYPQIEVVTGVNLPMVIEFGNQQLLGNGLNLSQLLSMGVTGITNVKERLASNDDEDEE